MRKTDAPSTRRTWTRRWRRGAPTVDEVAEFERLTQQRLYGERRSVDRLVGDHSQPRERT